MAGEDNGAKEQTGANASAGTQDSANQASQMQALNGGEGAGDTANNTNGDTDASTGSSSATDGGSKDGTSGNSAKEAQDAFTKQLAERDAEIAKLKAEIADAAKSKEATDKLTKQIAELEAKAEAERTDFQLKLAGARSTRAARAMLDEHDGDIEALKAAEPWLFEAATSTVGGVTGLPNAGAATNDESTLAHWREIAGLTD